MKFIYVLKSATQGLLANKGRSALTILGIVIGVMSIILIVAIGRGAEKLIVGEISGLGSDLMVVRPGQQPEGPTDLQGTLFADSLKERDVEALKRRGNVPHAREVVPVLAVPGSVSYEGDVFRAEILGWDADFMAETFDIFPEEGVLFGDIDIRQRASVAVIGSDVRDELFGGQEVIGEHIKIKGRNFRVVGVFPPRGQSTFFNIDKLVIVPYSTAQTYLLGIDYYHEVMIRADDPKYVDRTVYDIEATMRESHNITDPDKDDFFVVTQEGLVDQVQTILSALTAFLSSVVAVALLVGGIGVMNIMLVSVTERTKEIGLRKSVGATRRDILKQFLLEAVILTGVGGLIGVLLGFILSLGATYVLSHTLDLAWEFSFPITAALLGVGISALVGIIFGIYPANQASKKSPIEALRYE